MVVVGGDIYFANQVRTHWMDGMDGLGWVGLVSVSRSKQKHDISRAHIYAVGQQRMPNTSHLVYTD